jgi:hypothetical protein
MRAIDLLGGTEIISDEDCLELLRGEVIGRVAVVVNGHVEIFPVNYTMDGDCVVFRSNDGSKLHGIKTGDAAFEVDRIDPKAHAGWSVVVHGEGEDFPEADDPDAPGSPPPWTGRKDFLVRIRPRSITGRRVLPSPTATAGD